MKNVNTPEHLNSDPASRAQTGSPTDWYPGFLQKVNARGYEHPIDILGNKTKTPGAPLLRTRHFTLQDGQLHILKGILEKDLYRAGVDTMTLLALHGITRRVTEEQAALRSLGIDLDVEDEKTARYQELAGVPEGLGDFVSWFDIVARDALVKQGPTRGYNREDPYNFAEKGIGLELGSAIMVGDWTYSNRLWKAVDHMSPLVDGIDGYSPIAPQNDTHIPTYTVWPTTTADFLSITRERGVWDILTPERKRLYVAHRMVGMVVLSALSRDLRKSIKDLPPNAPIPKSVSKELGELFEADIATPGASYNGIIPESSTVFIRRTPKQV